MATTGAATKGAPYRACAVVDVDGVADHHGVQRAADVDEALRERAVDDREAAQSTTARPMPPSTNSTAESSSALCRNPRYRCLLFKHRSVANDTEEIAMHDLEQRAQQLVQDWKVLRKRLERIQQEQRLGQFYTMHLDHIEARLVEVPELVYCVVTDMSTPDDTPATTRPHARAQQPRCDGGFAALIRRARRAVEDIDIDD